MPVSSMATIGRLSGMDAQLLCAALGRGGDGSSLIRVVVARKETNMTAPAQKNVPRIPIRDGRNPPTKGPMRFPAMTPDESVPSAQPDRSFGVCVAMRTTAAEA